MTDQTNVPYASAYATSEIINREDLLEQVKMAVLDKSDVTYVFYITSPGGWGKTRLVEGILNMLQPSAPDSPRDVLAARWPVDLYHLSTHGAQGLVHEIYQALAPGPTYFAGYLEQNRKLEVAKYDISEVLQEVNRQLEQTIKAFIDDFNRLYPPYRRTVLALDTAETLVYKTDRVQQVLGLADEPMGVAALLLREYLPQVKRGVILLAGRADTTELAEALQQIHGIRLVDYPLRRFKEEHSLRYIEAVARLAHDNGSPETAQRIASIPLDTRQVLHLFSGGRPLLLALMLDYLAVTDELIPEVTVSLDEARERTRTEEGQRQIQDEISAAIVRRILETRRPADDVIRLLALTPKGMEPELLAPLLKLRSPVSEAEVDEARQQLKGLTEPRRLSFIKSRPDDNRVFLHDEMYEMLRPVTYDALSPGHRKRVESIMKGYTGARVKTARRHAQEIGAADSPPDERLTTRGPLTRRPPQVPPEELFKARAEVQTRQVDQVFYALRRNTDEGFELYREYADEASQSNDDGLHWQLRDLILRFRDTLVNLPSGSRATGGLRPLDIEREAGMQWIKRNLTQGEFKIVLNQIVLFRDKCKDLLHDPLAAAEMDVWEGQALVYVGDELDRAEQLELKAIHRLESMSRVLSRLRTCQRLLAEAYTYLGYGYRSQGRFRDAIVEYNHALPVWRELNAPSEHANTLNNLAWAEARAGDLEVALRHCEDGLRIRRWLGKRYPVALSLNTLGLILTRNGQPDRATEYCLQAWRIFRDLGLPRGVGLASIALAESLRRTISLPFLYEPEQAMEKLMQAEPRAREAVHVFEQDTPEPLRLVEALIELGCTYREMVRLGCNYKVIDADECKRLENEAQQALERAAQVAGNRYAYLRVDALVNLAWLRYYAQDSVGAQSILRGKQSQVLAVIAPEYLIVRGQGITEVPHPVEWFWVQLGKANLLLGQIVFDEYKQLNREAKRQEIKLEDRTEALARLKEAGRLWTLAEAYNTRYSESFYDLDASERRIYEHLAGLNPQELNVIRQSIAETIHEYSLPDKSQRMQRFVDKDFGPASTEVRSAP